jgi:hypothetical protein
VESRINADDDWFVGEDRLLQFRFVEGDTTGVEGWTMVLEFHPRRTDPSAIPLLAIPASGRAAATVGGEASAVATVTAEQTLTLGEGNFHFVLRRTDVGSRAVLSFGPAQLRSAVTA